ncbi:MAG: DsbA family protein, partial [Halobacteriaceae archaeon]
IDAKREAFLAYGVSGTPTFFINGQKLVGAQPYSKIRSVIDNQLQESEADKAEAGDGDIDRTIEMTAQQFRFNPSTIRVEQGNRIRL